MADLVASGLWWGLVTETGLFERVLRLLRERVRDRRFVMTVHAEEEMDEDGLTVFDLERCILSGKIVERQKDREAGDWKYLVRGATLADEEAIVVCKMSPTSKVVLITVYRV